jgi:hypothetical protein
VYLPEKIHTFTLFTDPGHDKLGFYVSYVTCEILVETYVQKRRSTIACPFKHRPRKTRVTRAANKRPACRRVAPLLAPASFEDWTAGTHPEIDPDHLDLVRLSLFGQIAPSGAHIHKRNLGAKFLELVPKLRKWSEPP